MLGVTKTTTGHNDPWVTTSFNVEVSHCNKMQLIYVKLLTKKTTNSFATSHIVVDFTSKGRIKGVEMYARLDDDVCEHLKEHLWRHTGLAWNHMQAILDDPDKLRYLELLVNLCRGIWVTWPVKGAESQINCSVPTS